MNLWTEGLVLWVFRFELIVFIKERSAYLHTSFSSTKIAYINIIFDQNFLINFWVEIYVLSKWQINIFSYLYVGLIKFEFWICNTLFQSIASYVNKLWC